MPDWTPEHPVDATLAASLVHHQFPALRRHVPRPGGHGWDNVVWRFGRLAFRFPQRALGVALIEVERRVLGSLPPLPLPVPTPSHVGEPTAAFPYPFWGGPWIPGRAGDLGPGEGARLGAFLRALHASLPEGVPDDDYKSFPARRLHKTLERLPALARRWDTDRLRAALEAPLPDPPAWVTCHGDLYGAHVLQVRGRVSGIIDWGDVRRGNPGMDLNVAWALLPAEEQEAFWAAYGADTPALRAWSRFYALNYGIVLTGYGVLARRPRFVRMGERALDATLPEARRRR